MERTPLVAGNWKMFKLRGEAAEFCDELLPLVDELDEVDLAICPPFTALDIVAERARRRRRRRLGPERPRRAGGRVHGRDRRARC